MIPAGSIKNVSRWVPKNTLPNIIFASTSHKQTIPYAPYRSAAGYSGLVSRQTAGDFPANPCSRQSLVLQG